MMTLYSLIRGRIGDGKDFFGFPLVKCHFVAHTKLCRRKVTGPVTVMGDAVCRAPFFSLLFFSPNPTFLLLPHPPDLWYIVL